MEELIIQDNKICLKVNSQWGGEIVRPLNPEQLADAKKEYDELKVKYDSVLTNIEGLKQQLEEKELELKSVDDKFSQFNGVFDVELVEEVEEESTFEEPQPQF